MIFSKLLPRKASMAVMILAGICFVGIAIANLGMPVDDLLIQLVAIVVLIVTLIAVALVAALLIRYLVNKTTAAEEFDEDDELEDHEQRDEK